MAMSSKAVLIVCLVLGLFLIVSARELAQETTKTDHTKSTEKSEVNPDNCEEGGGGPGTYGGGGVSYGGPGAYGGGGGRYPPTAKKTQKAN